MLEKFQNTIEKGLSVAKIAFLISLLSSFGTKAEAQDNGKDKIDLKHQIELAQDAIKKINVDLVEKCKDITQTVNGQNVNRYKFPNGQFVETADNGDYITISNKDGSRVFWDANSDGILDRAIIDDAKGISKSMIKRDFDRNTLDMSGSIEEISKSAEISSSVDPEKIKIFELRSEKGEVYFADNEDGQHGIITGQEAMNIIEKLQIAYTSQLENIVNNGNKIKETVEEVKNGEVKKDPTVNESKTLKIPWEGDKIGFKYPFDKEYKSDDKFYRAVVYIQDYFLEGATEDITYEAVDKVKNETGINASILDIKTLEQEVFKNEKTNLITVVLAFEVKKSSIPLEGGKKGQTPETPKPSSISGKPEKQPEYVKPTPENTANFIEENKKQFDAYKKSQQSSFDAFKKANQAEFDKFKNDREK